MDNVVVINGTSFPLSSAFIEAKRVFNKKEPLWFYVEGFEDVSFWKLQLKRLELPYKVVAFGSCNKANGKGTVISAIERGDLELGKCLGVALDSDYDYLLNQNTQILNSDFVFQTYSYSIENLQWHASHVDEICAVASNNDLHKRSPSFHNEIINWSKVIYSPFMKYLSDGVKNATSFEYIMNTLTEDGKSFNYSEAQFSDFEDENFVSLMRAKGLVPENTYLYVQGHNYANKLEKLCQSRVEEITNLVKDDLRQQHGSKAGQFIGEYCNSRSEPSVLVKTQPIDCDYCIPKIEQDILNFKQTYHS